MSVMAENVTALDRDVLVGEWHNTNAEGILSRIVIRANDRGTIDVQTFGRLAGMEADWGTVAAPVFSFEFNKPVAEAFLAIHELRGARIRLQANVKQGVLVVALFTEFSDDSGRLNHFDREFFHEVTK